MTTTIPIVKDQVNVITLKSAKDWHKTFKDQNKDEGFAKGVFPNSIVIPFADIEQIVHDFRDAVHETVNGVRIYFVIKPTKKENGKPNISCICVPTKGPHLNVTNIDPKERYTDMIIKAELRDDSPRNADSPGDNNNSDNRARVATFAAETDGSDEGYVTAYDVTQPCPPFCDPDSPIS